MKKFIMGTLFGAFLVSATAFADDVSLMVGKVVEGTFPVKVNGQSLAVEAIVIEGTSYAPVRVIGEAVGLEVTFDQKNGISLNNDMLRKEDRMMDFTELRKLEESLTEQISELFQIVRPYEVPTMNETGKVEIKEKDELYYQTKEMRDALTVERDEVSRRIIELSKQLAP